MRPGLMVGLLSLAVGAVLAHAGLSRGTPAPDERVKIPPKSVVLELAEPVEVRFSTFKVFALKARDLKAAKAEAEALFKSRLSLRNDEDDRADAGLATTAATAARVEVLLKEKLGPGYYAVMWRVLSVDTHTTSDFYVFSYQP